MRRSQFIREYENTSVDALICFCSGEDLYELYEDFISDESLDEMMNSRFRDMIDERPWYEVRDYMNDVPQGYEWYVTNQFDDEVYGADEDDARRLYNDIIAYFDHNGMWDDEVDESDEEDIDDGFDEEGEEFNLIEMIQSNAHIMSA